MSTPAEDRTAAPSLTITWEPSAPGSISLKTWSSDNLSSHGAEKGPREEEERGQAEKEDDPTAGHLSVLPLVSLTIALSATVFLVAMDVNVIATAVPRITGEFRSLDDVGWYGSSFLMATCATQIPYGRVYSLFPSKWVFISAILIFMLGSLVAATSANSPILIFGRAIQGVGTSGILSGGLIIISQVVPLRIRPILTSAIGAMEGVAMISAPIIGGVLTDNLNWRWCFYINLPIGGFVLLVVVFCMRNTRPVGRRRQAGTTLLRTLYELDLLGAAALLPPIVCTLLALHYAGK
jgi:MFS family permease